MQKIHEVRTLISETADRIWHLSTSEFTELLEKIENPDEKELVSVIFNTILQQKQRKVISENIF